MQYIKEACFKISETVMMLGIGLLVTLKLLKPLYESFGIEFMGNVWVNWFGVSYFLFVLYTLIVRFTVSKEITNYQNRLTSVLFWLLFIGANYIIFLPFVRGENPF